jgi:hypothetical protein
MTGRTTTTMLLLQLLLLLLLSLTLMWFLFFFLFEGLTGFAWISMFLSTVIAFERCFCVVFPLKAQHAMSARRMTVVIVVAACVIMGGQLAIVGHKHTMACVFDPLTNLTSSIVYVTQ